MPAHIVLYDHQSEGQTSRLQHAVLHLLVAPLDRAVPLPQVDYIAIPISQDLPSQGFDQW